MKIFYFFSWLLLGLFCTFPLACLSSGIYKVEDEKGHVTYTNTPSVMGKRTDAKKLTGAASINIITPRSAVKTRYENLAVASRYEDNSSAGLQKHDLDAYLITDQKSATQSRRLGNSLRVPDTSTIPTSRTTREKFAHDQLSIDDYNIQVFDLKIRSY